MAKKEKKYSDALQELEQLLQGIESGQTDLDALPAKLAEAKELLNGMHTRLANAEKIIVDWEKDD